MKIWKNIQFSQAGSAGSGGGGGGGTTSFDTDSGTATPAAGVITIAGGTNINTSGAGSTVTINLDNIVSLTHADDGSTQGYFQFNAINFMHNYGADNTFVGELAGNSTLTPASALGNTAIGMLAGSSLTTGALNTLIGNLSGNLMTSGNNNTALGQGSLGVTTASGCTALGFNALAAFDPGAGDRQAIAVGFDCLQTTILGSGFVAIGSECGQNLFSVINCTLIGTQCCDISASIGDGCICIGYQCGRNATMGPNNIIIGNLGGTAYLVSEQDNILINHIGISGDLNTIRIGTQGAGSNQQNLCFVAGITGVNVGSVVDVVSIATGTGQLGTTAITAGTGISITPGASVITIAASGTLTSTYTAVNTTPYVVLTTDQFLGVDSSGGAITIQLPDAPATGRIFAVKDSTGSANTNAITVTTVGGVVLIDGAATYPMNTQYAAIQVIFNGTSYEIF